MKEAAELKANLLMQELARGAGQARNSLGRDIDVLHGHFSTVADALARETLVSIVAMQYRGLALHQAGRELTTAPPRLFLAMGYNTADDRAMKPLRPEDPRDSNHPNITDITIDHIIQALGEGQITINEPPKLSTRIEQRRNGHSSDYDWLKPPY